ncbi:MAG TPA: extracellular solute-binding protein [Verrucomicrobiae bacterium]|nr:extracellular solute-binding protein [Verrucomicrobiae bacterium]
MSLFQQSVKARLLAFCFILTLLSGIGRGTLLGAEPQLVERAKKEGTFLLYTSMNTPDVNQIFDGFRKRYPFITPKSYTTRSAALLERIVTEARAGKHFADVIQGNAFTLYLLAKKGHTEQYISREAKSFPDSFRDPAGGWIAAYLQLNVISYNTKLVNKSESPKGYDDLLNAKWKGKMGLDDKQYIWFDGLLKVMGREKGLAYFKRLATQAIHFRSGNTLLANLLAAGEFGILINARPESVDELKQKGAPVEWVAPKPTTANVLPIAVAKNAQNPNAAKLFMDHMLSEEGQRILSAMSRTPARPGVSTANPRLSGLEIAVNDPAMAERFDQVVEVYKSVFALP